MRVYRHMSLHTRVLLCHEVVCLQWGVTVINVCWLISRGWNSEKLLIHPTVLLSVLPLHHHATLAGVLSVTPDS